MTTFKRRLVRIGNRISVWMYRASDGRLAKYNKNAKVLMITTPGRRTGVLHSTCVRYLETPEGFLVWGTRVRRTKRSGLVPQLAQGQGCRRTDGSQDVAASGPRELLAEERDSTWTERRVGSSSRGGEIRRNEPAGRFR